LNSGDNLLLVSTVADCLERGCGGKMSPKPPPKQKKTKFKIYFFFLKK
jgi:hypothetical protein